MGIVFLWEFFCLVCKGGLKIFQGSSEVFLGVALVIEGQEIFWLTWLETFIDNLTSDHIVKGFVKSLDDSP